MNPYEAPAARREPARVLPSSRGYEAPGWRSTTACVLFAAVGGARVLSALLLYPGTRELRAVGQLLGTVATQTTAFAAAFFIVWVHQVVKNATTFQRDFPFSAESAIWWWFVPFANLVQPYRLLSATWRASQWDPEPTFNWETNRTTPLIAAWWVTWIFGGLWSLGTHYAHDSSLIVIAVTLTISIVSGIKMIRSLDALQRDFASRAAPKKKKRKKKKSVELEAPAEVDAEVADVG